MKAVMMSIQPYWVFLIIAKAMGWEIEQHKEIEVRKNFPKAEDWNKVVKIYCSKDKKSSDRIPEKYKPAMKKFLGKVIGEFVCNDIEPLTEYDLLYGMDEISNSDIEEKSCVDIDELLRYKGKNDFLYGWHINDLVIYDKPKSLEMFPTGKIARDCGCGGYMIYDKILTRPPQSWGYVEEKE